MWKEVSAPVVRSSLWALLQRESQTARGYSEGSGQSYSAGDRVVIMEWTTGGDSSCLVGDCGSSHVDRLCRPGTTR